MSPKCHMEEGIAVRASHHPMEETHRKCRKLNSLFDCGRRGGEDSGGFLQEGLKDAEGWAGGKEWWGKVGGETASPSLSLEYTFYFKPGKSQLLA